VYESLGTVRLRNGEDVEAGVVHGPDGEWADRVEDLLSHKHGVWRWQNAECLRQDLGIDIAFYVLHRAGVPFANILTATLGGVGHFGHVYTREADRRQGAATQLMGLQMEHFRGAGGRALYLGTGFDSSAYHIYHGHGFRSLESGSGQMEYYSDRRESFHADWFAQGPVEIQGTSWGHWPTTGPLFTADLPGTIRCAPLGLLGRASTEGAWLRLLHTDPARARVLAAGAGAVVGAAVWGEHPQWPQTTLVDVFCHPSFWEWGAELLGSLELPPTERCVAVSDDGCPTKGDILAAAGFASAAQLPQRVAVDTVRTRFVDVTEWER
jgi:GNAT superfamily N-acetyltransferase